MQKTKSKEEKDGQKLQIIRDDDLGINIVVNPERNLDQSLKQANDELCDAFMLYKDLANRCVIDFQNLQSNGSVGKEGPSYEDDVDQELNETKTISTKNRDRYTKKDEETMARQKKLMPFKKKKAAKVFYFKPESFMMADPDTQRLFREQLINRIKQPPQLSQPRLMAQDLQKQLIETVADRSNPSQMRKLLADYFKRKQYCLQHKRYKLLIRWAHHAIRTRNIDSLSQQATFRCSKLQWDIDNSIKRAQRLQEEDDYLLGMHDNLRPSSKSDQNDGTLYLEIKDLPPHSSIREDDIEIYLRHITYAEKINKLINKWIAGLKWMPLSNRYDIFDQMVDKYFQIRENNLNVQFEFWQRTEKHTLSINLHTPELLDELKQLKEDCHILNYKKQMNSVKQKTLGACRPDYDIVPDLINNNPEIKMRVKDMAKLFGLTADLDQDEGFSFGYQLTLFFPTQFQMLVLRSTFSIYDAFAGQSDELTMKKQRNSQSSVRVDPNLFIDVSTNQNLVPNEESLTSESQRQNIKIIRLKSASWLQYVSVFPRIPDWQRKQDAILASEDNPIDHLLQGTMDFLDVNDLASVNIIIAEASQTHVEIVKKLKILNEQEKDSKLKMKVQVPSGFQQKNDLKSNEDNNDNQDIAVEQEVYQTVSATTIQEMNNSMYQHMSNCLTGANLLEKIY